MSYFTAASSVLETPRESLTTAEAEVCHNLPSGPYPQSFVGVVSKTTCGNAAHIFYASNAVIPLLIRIVLATINC